MGNNHPEKTEGSRTSCEPHHALYFLTEENKRPYGMFYRAADKTAVASKVLGNQIVVSYHVQYIKGSRMQGMTQRDTMSLDQCT